MDLTAQLVGRGLQGLLHVSTLLDMAGSHKTLSGETSFDTEVGLQFLVFHVGQTRSPARQIVTGSRYREQGLTPKFHFAIRQ
jgi:hypothetical protein